MKKSFISMAMVLAIAAGAGEGKTVFAGGKASQWRKYVSAAPESGVLQAALPLPIRYGYPVFEVAPDKKYAICGEFRLTEAETQAQLEAGLLCIAANGKGIFPYNCLPLKNIPLGKLAAEAPAGSRSVTVSGIPELNAVKKNYLCLAFNAKEDESDLPNFEVSPFITVNGVKKQNGNLLITLEKPLDKSFAADTPVRIHTHGGVFVYAVRNQKLTSQWTVVRKVISGRQLRPGTVRAQMIFGVNGKGPGKVEFRNLQVIEL